MDDETSPSSAPTQEPTPTISAPPHSPHLLHVVLSYSGLYPNSFLYTNSTWVTLTSPASLLYQGGSSSQPPRYRPEVAQMQGSTSPEGEPQQPQPPLEAEPRRNPSRNR
ncbi:hypothetical protein Gotri_027608 [Gossypium trilobum]|uniref:Uncharacterized protein n=1 Tax=Gossypium trilobum TaxID=34281 RepID=A0A7J9FPM8_9ROSI|nr:hypothetical protein [Gossypium trilobum]